MKINQKAEEIITMRKYTIILDPANEEGGYTITIPALPGCITQGETVEQCIEGAHEAIEGYIESLLADGEPVPEETERPQMITIDAVALVPPIQSNEGPWKK